jgi:WD40 repeat protein
VTHVAWSPDGHVVVSSGADGTVLLWRMRGIVGAGSLAGTLAGGRGTVDALAFSPDSARLISGGSDGVLRVWDAIPDPELAVLGRASGPALAARWTLGGAVGLWPHVVQAYVGRRQTHVLRSRDRFAVLASSRDSTVVVLGTVHGATEAWDTRTGKVTAATHLRGPVTAVAAAPHGSLAAGGDADGTVSVVGRWTRRQHGAVSAMEFSSDGALLLTGGSRAATLWDARTGKELHVLPTPGGVTSVALSRDAALAAVAGRDGLARLWRTATGRPYRVLRAHTKAVTDVVFSDDGRIVATSGLDAEGRIWNVATGNHFALQRRSFGPLAAIALDATGQWAAGAAPISVIVWSAVTGRSLFYLRGHTDRLTSVGFAPATETILTSSRDGTVRTYACELCADRNTLVHIAKVRLVQTR